MPKVRLKVLNIQDVAETQLCCGCGACAYICPSRIEMVDTLKYGRQPRLRNSARSDGELAEAMRVCPGIGLERPSNPQTAGLIHELLPAWGPVLEVWEGYAAHRGFRFAGSSGGAASALAVFCFEQAGMHGVLHISARSDIPYLNQTVLSTTRKEILERTGSRYAPASPCDGLKMIEEAPGPCVFIGKPCDVAAVQKARKLRPKLDEKLGLTIAFFCAGTPSTKGTLEMLKRMGIDDPATLVSLRYRGNGWPGRATAVVRTEAGEETRELTYEQSWDDVLQKHRQWRCYVCADHSGEFADIAVGDPWYRPVADESLGRSFILARTALGRRILHEAKDAGYLEIERAEPSIVSASQPDLLRTRGAIWGRILTLRLMGAAVPRFRGMPMFRFWWSELSLKEKARSFYGTMKRVFTKRLRKRISVEPLGQSNPCSGGPQA